MEISIESIIDQSLKNNIIQVDIENIKEYLPIAPKSEIMLGVHLTGALNFLSNNQYSLAGKFLMLNTFLITILAFKFLIGLLLYTNSSFL